MTQQWFWGCNYSLVLVESGVCREMLSCGGAMKLLYFPTITVPDEGWLRRALLYSRGDSIYSPKRLFRTT